MAKQTLAAYTFRAWAFLSRTLFGGDGEEAEATARASLYHLVQGVPIKPYRVQGTEQASQSIQGVPQIGYRVKGDPR